MKLKILNLIVLGFIVGFQVEYGDDDDDAIKKPRFVFVNVNSEKQFNKIIKRGAFKEHKITAFHFCPNTRANFCKDLTTRAITS